MPSPLSSRTSPPPSTPTNPKNPSTSSPPPSIEQTQAPAEEPTSTPSIATATTTTTTTVTTTTNRDDVNAARVRARKIAALETKIAALKGELEMNQVKEEEVRGVLNPSSPPELTVQNHISLLHEYNRIRDIGTGLLGIIAENRGVRVRDLWEEFGVGEGD